MGGLAVTLDIVNWHITEHDGVKILERLTIRESSDRTGPPYRYHVFRVVGRSTVTMYDVFELPTGRDRAEHIDDLKPVWPPGRDYNRPSPDV